MQGYWPFNASPIEPNGRRVRQRQEKLTAIACEKSKAAPDALARAFVPRGEKKRSGVVRKNLPKPAMDPVSERRVQRDDIATVASHIWYHEALSRGLRVEGAETRSMHFLSSVRYSIRAEKCR